MESTDTLRNAHAAQRHVSSVPSSCTDNVTTKGRTKSQNQCIVATVAQCIDRPRFEPFHAVISKRIGVLSSVPKLMQKAQVYRCLGRVFCCRHKSDTMHTKRISLAPLLAPKARRELQQCLWRAVISPPSLLLFFVFFFFVGGPPKGPLQPFFFFGLFFCWRGRLKQVLVGKSWTGPAGALCCNFAVSKKQVPDITV